MRKEKIQKLNLFGYVNKCVHGINQIIIFCLEHVTKRKERLISWEKLVYDHFNSTSRFSILITLKEVPDLRPAMEVWVFFFSLSIDDFTTLG